MVEKNVYKGKMKVLLVEDYASLAMMLKELAHFSAPSCTIEWLDDGQKAVEVIQKGAQYDAVIMNYQMPLMDGPAAARMLRQAGYTKPIIAWSAFAARDKKQACLEAGMNAYVEKSGDLAPTLQMLKDLEARKFDPKPRD